MTVRPSTESDVEAMISVMVEAVRVGAAGAYSEVQRRAWLPAAPAADAFRRRLAGQTVWVEEDGDDRLLGFMTLTPDGGIDLAFVRPEAMGNGVAARLYDALIAHARTHGVTRLWSDASLLFEPFLARRGWRVVRRQQIERGGVPLQNCRMEIDLGG
jgi:putative acetyltransferase